MHEMGVVIQIVKTANKYAMQNGATEVRRLSLEIGEASAVLPKYVYAFFDDVIPDYPAMRNCKLEIETVPARAFCQDCGNVFYPTSGISEMCEDCDPDTAPKCSNCFAPKKKEGPRRLRDEKLAGGPRCPRCRSELFRIIDGNSIMIRDMEIL